MTDKKSKLLPARLYRQMNTEKKAKKFAYKSSTDEKREFLSYLDIGFFWTFAAVKEFTSRDYLPILKELKKDNPVAAVDIMCDRGISVSTDLEYVNRMTQMSHVSSSGAYVKSMERARLGAITKSWSRKFSPDTDSEDVDNSAKVLAKYNESFIRIHRYIESLIGISENEYRVLNMLYERKGKYVELEEIWEYFSGEIGQRKLSFGVNVLMKEFLIQKYYDFSSKKYTITKSGVRLINEFQNRILKSSNF